MPKVTITNKKGLVQSSGDGLVVDSSATVNGVLVSTNTAGQRDARSFRDVTSGVAKTTMTATALSVNTHYVASTSTALAMTIPSAAAGSTGDWISVFYTTAIDNAATQSFTTTTDTAYALSSTITRIGGAVTSATDLSVAADNVLNLLGDTNGDCGQGTTVKFVNTTGALNGWAVEAVILNQGTGAEALGSAFA
jgi:hypothetical protein